MPATKKTGSLLSTLKYPHQFEPHRLPVSLAAERTTTVDLNIPAKMFVGINDTRGLLTRQAAYPFWLDWPFRKNDECYMACAAYRPVHHNSGSADVYYESPTTINVGNSQGLEASWAANKIDPGFPAIGNVTASSALAWNVPIMGMDKTDDKPPFLYLPSTAVSGIYVLLPEAATDPIPIVAEIEIWTSSGVAVNRRSNAITLPSGKRWVDIPLTEFSVSTNGLWVRPLRVYAVGNWNYLAPPSPDPNDGPGPTYAPVIYLYTAGGALDATASFDGTTGVITFTSSQDHADYPGPLMPLPAHQDFYAITQPWMDTRVTASAIRASNVSKVMSKEGIILAGRLPFNSKAFNFSATDLAALHPLEKEQLMLETGIRTFTIPSTDLADFKNYSATQDVTGAVMSDLASFLTERSPIVDLSALSYCNAFICQDPDGGSTLSLNVDWHLEFRHRTTVWELGVARTKLEQLHAAIRIMSLSRLFLPSESTLSAERGFAPRGRPAVKSAPGPRAKAAAPNKTKKEKKGKKQKGVVDKRTTPAGQKLPKNWHPPMALPKAK